MQALSNQREALSLARGVAERTERQISNRDYNTTVFRVAAASAELAGLLEAVRGYQSLAVNNSGLSQELGARQPELRGMLTAAGSLAAGTVGVASQAVSIIAETQTAEDSLQVSSHPHPVLTLTPHTVTAGTDARGSRGSERGRGEGE